MEPRHVCHILISLRVDHVIPSSMSNLTNTSFLIIIINIFSIPTRYHRQWEHRLTFIPIISTTLIHHPSWRKQRKNSLKRRRHSRRQFVNSRLRRPGSSSGGRRPGFIRIASFRPNGGFHRKQRKLPRSQSSRRIAGDNGSILRHKT